MSNSNVWDTADNRYSVQPKYLFAIYLIVPIVFLVVVCDWFFMDKALRNLMQINPMQILWYVILFGAPHIVASTVAYWDKEYCRYYKKPLLMGIAGALAISYATYLFLPEVVGFLLLTSITMVHFVGQQAGISKMFLRQPVEYFRLWQWSMVVISCIVAATVGFESGQNYLQYVSHASWLLGAYLLFTTYLVVLMIKQLPSWRRAWYLLFTHAMAVCVVLFLVLDYPFFVVLVPRMVHDLTAFVFYTAHDASRLQQSRGNYLYRLLHFRPAYVLLGLPLVSISLALLLSNLLPPVIILAIAYFHYYIEGVAWKNGTPHRQNLSLAA